MNHFIPSQTKIIASRQCNIAQGVQTFYNRRCTIYSKIFCGLKRIIIIVLYKDNSYCCSKQCCYFNTFITQKKDIMLRILFINYSNAVTVKNNISCIGGIDWYLSTAFIQKTTNIAVANFTRFFSHQQILEETDFVKY